MGTAQKQRPVLLLVTQQLNVSIGKPQAPIDHVSIHGLYDDNDQDRQTAPLQPSLYLCR